MLLAGDAMSGGFCWAMELGGGVSDHNTPALIAEPADSPASTPSLTDTTVLSGSGSGTIAGRVWDDADDDGVQDTGEAGLASWTVFADLNENTRLDAGEPSTTSDAQGSYSLSGLGAGTYTIAVETASGWKPTYPPLAPGEIEIASVASDGTQSDRGTYYGSLSQDGRYLAFESLATNLVANDTNALGDIFVRDRQTGTTERITVGPAGEQSDAASFNPTITPDGRFVAFASSATNLVAGDANGQADVFVNDRSTGVTQRVSEAVDGSSGNGSSSGGSISHDGRYIAFTSSASNLVAGDTNGVQDVFVYDRQTSTIERVSINGDGVEGAGTSFSSSISADGRFVAFVSLASNLVSGDTNGTYDVFVYDRQTGAVERVSVSTTGDEGQGRSNEPSISADGRYVAYYSAAANLVELDTNEAEDIFVFDRVTREVERVSVSESGHQANDSSTSPMISADGRVVVYRSNASNLVAGDTANTDVFAVDRTTYAVRRLNVAEDGTQASTYAVLSAVSPGGEHVAFHSFANTLVPGDTNNQTDLFVVQTGLQATHTVTLADGQQVAEIDFGNREMVGQIRGLVWNDVDENGVRNVAEGSLANWTVYLDQNDNGQFDAGEPSTLTDGDGNYAFTGLADGAYAVAQVIPPGWGQTYPGDVRFDPLFQASIRDQPLDGVADSFNSSEWLVSQTSSAENRVVHEFDLSHFAGQRTGSASLDLELFINNGGGQSTRPFSIYLYDADGASTLDDYSVPGVYAGSATINTSDGNKAFHVNITSALRTVLGRGATHVGVRIDPAGTNIFATGVRDLRLVAAAPALGASHRFFLTPGQIRDDVDFGDRDVHPFVASVVRNDASPTAAASVQYTVTFTEAVSGVDVSDFAVTAVGPSGAAVTGVTGSGNTYVVTVGTGSGDGTVRLDVRDDNSIIDASGNRLGGNAPGDGDFTSAQLYVIDRDLPLVTDVVRVDTSPTRAGSVSFDVTFSEPVSGVNPSDFSITAASLSGASMLNVGGGPLTYRVTVSTGSGEGSLRLDVLADGTIVDSAGKALVTPFTTGQEYQIDHVAPQIVSVVRRDPDPTTATTVRYGVTFSEPVTGVNADDFVLNAVGPAGVSIGSVTGSGTDYTVWVNVGSGDGRLRLDVLDDNTIVDAVGNPTAAGFVSGETYVVDRNDPAVVSIVRAGPNPTSAGAVAFTVTFSEPVSGLDAGDFALAVGGLTDASVTSVSNTDSGDGFVYRVIASTGLGDGTLRLDLMDDDSVVDDAASPLGGAGAANGDFTGEAYWVIHTPGIYGAKWADVDGDGAWDAGEPGMAGVTVFLDENLNGVPDTGELTTTSQPDDPTTADIDETGHYAFTGLDAGIYGVGEIVPDYFEQTYPAVSGGTGKLEFVGSVIDGRDDVDGLWNAQSVAVSPDGKHVYGAAASDDAVTVFRRDGVTGTLDLAQRITRTSSVLLDGAYAVAVMPDGSQVLAVSQYDDALVIFDRDADTGLLTFRQSFKDGLSNVDGLNGAAFVAISPDGKHAYAASVQDSGLSVFARNASTGGWSYVEHRRDGVSGVDGLSGARAVVVSPDGLHVYAAAMYENKVSIFTRDSATGSLTYQASVQDGVSGVDGLYRPVAVTVSPDGENLYVAGHYDDAIAVFQRDAATGALNYVHRLRDGLDGADGLLRASSVAVSSDGGYVYATGSSDHRVAVFSRAAGNGALTYIASVSEYDTGVDGMTTPWSVAVSPNDLHVYVASYSSNAIAAFARDGGEPARTHKVAYSAGQVVLNRDFGNRRLPLEVVASQPVDGAMLNAPPTTIRVDFNFDVDPETVQAADLTVGGVPATGIAIVDGDTVDFGLPALAEGPHAASMAADSILPLGGGLGLLPLELRFTVDLTTPQVAVVSLTTTDISPALTGTVDDAAAAVAVTVDGATYAATNNGNGTWSIADNTLTLLPYGVYDVKATATDPAGNASTDATTEELEIIRSLVGVSGPESVVEGTAYVATLAHHPSLEPIGSWTIDWGDGSIETITGDPSTASHTYADGTLGYAVRATAHGQSGAMYRSTVAVSPDPAFGAGGYVDVPLRALSSSSQLDLVAQADGKVLSVGQDGQRWILERRLADGSPDASFGVGGQIFAEFPGLADTATMPRGVAVKSDGKIVVAGNAGLQHWAVTQYHPDGTADASFGTGGVVLINRGNQSRINALAIDDGDRIVLGGTEWIGAGSNLVVARIGSDGAPDPGFGSGGIVSTVPARNSYGSVEDLAIDSRGRIVAAGTFAGGTGYAAAVRYLPDGALDTSFSEDGQFWQYAVGNGAYARAVAIDRADRVILAADTTTYGGNDTELGLMRLGRYGTLDATFGDEGRVTLDIAGTNDFVGDVVIQRDGRIVVAGKTFVSGNGYDVAIARFNEDGARDASFDGDGTWTAPPRPGVFEHVYAVALDHDDRLLAVVGYEDHMELARYDLNPGWFAQVLDQPPQLVAAGPTSIDEGLVYTLSLSVVDPGDDVIDHWTIDWGDGHQEFAVGSATEVAHVYLQGGASYSPVVTAVTDDGDFIAAAPTILVNQVARGQVSGVKWNDVDADGVRDDGERGIGGVTVFVDLNDNGLLDTDEPSATTAFDDPNTAEDEGGLYRIEGVVQGTHAIAEQLPAGRTQTFPGPAALPLERVSWTAWGGETNGDSGAPQISDDGRYIAFRSSASDLVPGDTNGVMDLFIYDRVLGTMRRANLTETGQQNNRQVTTWALSGDGRTVAYESWRYMSTTSLTVQDLETGLYDWNVSGSYNGPSLSADGRYLAYDYYNSSPFDAAVYWRDLQSPNVIVAGSGNSNSGHSSISGDGQSVAFTTHASDVVPGDTNGHGDVILFRRSGGKARVSVSSAGAQGNGDSYQPDVSQDGRYVAFTSEADNLVADDNNGYSDIFVRDTISGTTDRVSVASDGLQANGRSLGASISADGRYILFASQASNLVAGDTNGLQDLFLHDRVLKTTQRVSVGRDGSEANGASYLYSMQAALSADGRYVGFSSAATNLIEADTNGYTDVFVTPTTAGRDAGVHRIHVASGQTVTDVHFASQGPAGRIAGQLWQDDDLDGVRDPAELPLVGRTMYLDINHNDRLDADEPTTTTDADGDYEFEGLLPGTYDVLSVPVAGWRQSSPAPLSGDYAYIDADALDHVYDATRGVIYLTGIGQVRRYDLQTQTFLAPWMIGDAPVRGADITPDGRYLYVAGGTNAHEFHKIDIETGAVTAIPYVPESSEGGPWDVGITSNGYAFLSTQGNGTVPLRRVDLADGSVTVAQSTYYRRNLWPSFDGTRMVLAGDVLASHIYDAATDAFTVRSSGIRDDAVAISRDNRFIAAATYSTLLVFDASLENVVFSAGNYDLNGGVVFDPVRDLMYVGNASTNRVVAYDTNSWTPQFEFSGFLHGIQRYQDYSEGLISVSPDGRLLLVSTGSAIQSVRLAPRHRVELTLGESATGLDFGEQRVDAIMVSESDGTTAVAENGSQDQKSDSFQVALGAPPRGEVVITVSSSAVGEAVVSPATLVFSPGNWNTPQAVSVQGVNDNSHDGDGVVTLTLAVDDAASDDVFDAVRDATVAVHVFDVPVAPQVTAPQGSGHPAQPTVTFRNAAGATSYNLWLVNLDTGQNAHSNFAIAPGDGDSTSYTIATSLPDGRYRVFISGNNARGYGGWGVTDFSVGGRQAIPAAPTGLAADQAANPPVITWKPSSAASYYNVWMVRMSDSAVYSARVTDAAYTPPSVLDAGAYRVFVSAGNSSGISSWSAPYDFFVGASTPPQAPSGFKLEGSPLSVRWTPVATATHYDAWLVRLSDGQHIPTPRVTTASLDVSSLAAGGYRVFVAASNAVGRSGWSSAYDFNVGAPPVAPAAPVGLTVLNTHTQRPTLQWQPSDGATGYAIWVVDMSTGQAIASQTDLTVASYTPSGDWTDGGYRFLVRAYNHVGSSGWAGPYDFTIDTTVPAASMSALSAEAVDAAIGSTL